MTQERTNQNRDHKKEKTNSRSTKKRTTALFGHIRNKQKARSKASEGTKRERKITERPKTYEFRNCKHPRTT